MKKKIFIKTNKSCRMHYLEYLSILIRQHKLDPISVLSADDLETIVRRAAKKLPPNAWGTPRGVYRTRLLQVYLFSVIERMLIFFIERVFNF